MIWTLASFNGGCALFGIPPVELISVCPTIAEYTIEEQQKTKTEYDRLKKAGANPHIIMLVDDYGKLRAKIRACKDEKANAAP